MSAASVRGADDFLHGILADADAAAGEIRVFLHNVRIDFPDEIDIFLRVCIADDLALRDIFIAHARKRPGIFGDMAIQKKSVVRGSL